MIHDVGKITEPVDKRKQGHELRTDDDYVPLRTLPVTQGNSGGLIAPHLPKHLSSQAHCWGFLVSSGLSWCFATDSFLFS